MHEWHTRTSTNIQALIGHFMGYEFDTDYGGREEVTGITIASKLYNDVDTARTYVTDASYGSNTAVIAAYKTSDSAKITKAYNEAFANLLKRRREFVEFDRGLNIAYGRKASKVTCPNCSSSINLAYGSRFKACPVCGSSKIISDSNWNILKTKEGLVSKASAALQKEAEKCGISFICGIEWHC